MNRPKVVILWVNFGPYHVARVKALANSLDVFPVQLSSQQRLYGWTAAHSVPMETLCHGAYETASGLRLSRAIWRTLERIRPDCLLIPGYSELPFLAAALWGRTHSALNVLMSDSTSIDFLRSPWKETAKRSLIQAFFDRAIVSGKRARNYLSSLGLPSSRIGLFYDVVDNDFFRSGTADLRASADAGAFGLPVNYFLFVGRLVAAKNLEQLIRAFSAYRKSGGKSALVLVGQGPLEPELKALASDLQLSDSVQFRGFKTYEQLIPFYAFARCLVLPSLLEQWGLVVNEALASGLPVIVSDRCGCADDLVENQANGFTFDPTSKDDLTQRLHQISRLSAQALTSMGLRSREIVERYSLDAWSKEALRMVSGNFQEDPPSVAPHDAVAADLAKAGHAGASAN